MRVLFVTSPDRECGIHEHGEMLQEALLEVAPEFVLEPIEPSVHEVSSAVHDGPAPDLIVINHQANLHAAFTPERVREWNARVPVVVIQHDTLQTRALMLDRGLPDFVGACSALIVHEPVEGLTQTKGFAERHPGADLLFTLERGTDRHWTDIHCIRQGIPRGPRPATLEEQLRKSLRAGPSSAPPEPPAPPAWPARPVVGTVGFPFPWKNYDLLCKCARATGWDVLLIAPRATVEQCEAWQALHPGHVEIVPQFIPRQEVIERLSACNATAFLYQTGNTGTSGAIRLGFATRRPVIALKNRQVLDLLGNAVGRRAAMWCESEDEVVQALAALAVDNDLWLLCAGWASVLVETDSWTNTARAIATVFRGAVAQGRRAEGARSVEGASR